MSNFSKRDFQAGHLAVLIVAFVLGASAWIAQNAVRGALTAIGVYLALMFLIFMGRFFERRRRRGDRT